MIVIKNEETCCGCFACYNRCPKNAITMKPNKEGFVYPVVDESACVDCGLCEKVCPMIHKKETKNEPLSFACRNNDETVRSRSSSGGVFTLLAEAVLQENGVVYGAAFDENWNVHHRRIESADEIDRIRRSKYVQSNIGDTYTRAKADLDAGKTVLFTGTPCQINGLYAFLNKNYERLYTQDMICHGVPSPGIWQKYLEEQRSAHAGQAITDISFRDKTKSPVGHGMKLAYGDSETITPVLEDPYSVMFLGNFILRKSCYPCKFNEVNRISDITLADFWGIADEYPDFDDGKATSLVIVNSEKGKRLFELIADRMTYRQTDYQKSLGHNHYPGQQYRMPLVRDLVFRKIRKGTFSDGYRVYLNNTSKKYLPYKLVKTIGGRLKKEK